MGPEHTDGLAALDEHRLVRLQRREGASHRIERVPAARGAAGAAVHDEIVRSLGHLWVEVVVHHPVGRFLWPTETGEVGAAVGADGTGTGHLEDLQRTDGGFDGRQHAAVVQQRLGGPEVWGQPAIGPGAGHPFAQHAECRAGTGAGIDG